MKTIKYILAFLLMMAAASSAQATTFSYLKFTTTSGDTLAYSVEDLKITFANGYAYITNADGNSNLALINQANMYFSNGDQEPSTTLIGDVNLDGRVDASDIACVVQIIIGELPAGTFDERDDVNDDGSVDSNDIATLVTIISSSD